LKRKQKQGIVWYRNAWYATRYVQKDKTNIHENTQKARKDNKNAHKNTEVARMAYDTKASQECRVPEKTAAHSTAAGTT
jgi:hypothetical protein